MTSPDNRPLVARPRGRQRTTIDDVAREAGVSKGTVSRVMNGKNWVKDSTRSAVLSAMHRTGYVANASARSLATRRTGSVALVLGAPATQLFEDPNYAAMLQALTEELAAVDYSLLFMTAASTDDRARLARFLRGGHVDAVLFLSSGELHSDDLVDLLEAHPVPVLVNGRPFPNGDPLPFVAGDDVGGGQLLAAHFIERGYERVAVIGAHLGAFGSRIRVQSFLDGLGERSRPEWVVEAEDYNIEAGRESMRMLLSTGENFDAVFAVSDVLAAGALEAIHDAGLRIPQDIAVAGFDDSAIASRTVPTLTTIRQDSWEGARRIVKLIVRAIEGDEIESETVPVSLVVRDST